MGLGVDDAGAHHVVRVRVDALEQLHAKAHQFVARPRQVQRLLGLEDALGALLFAGDNIMVISNAFFSAKKLSALNVNINNHKNFLFNINSNNNTVPHAK